MDGTDEALCGKAKSMLHAAVAPYHHYLTDERDRQYGHGVRKN